MLDFTPDISRLTAKEFMTQILKERFQVKYLVIGYDHRFGHNRSEGFDDYVRYGQAIGIEVIRAQAYTDDIQIDTIQSAPVSSSLIRKLLHQGDVDAAARCLGYEYFLDGTVVGGYQVGRKIGFPTANLSVDDPDKLIPADGVYAVWVTFDGKDLYGNAEYRRPPYHRKWSQPHNRSEYPSFPLRHLRQIYPAYFRETDTPRTEIR